jgi:molybdopterin-guanine dinucleotide biosynthesis adapter protein
MKNIKPKIIALKGFSNSGKTTSLESIVKYLTGIGKKTSVVKYIHMDNFSIDQPGKDTWKIRQSGGDPIISYSKHEIAFLTNQPLNLEQTIQIILSLRNDLDYIFLEGFWRNLFPKVLFIKSRKDFEELVQQIMQSVHGEEILLSCFCLSGIYFVRSDWDKSDFLSTITKLHKSKVIDSLIAKHLSNLPIVNIKEDPKELIRLFKKLL